MSPSQPEPTEPRIIKKKKGGEGGHGGAWKVAYADFVTAMMALFIVLWIMAQSQSIRNNVAQYFKNPGILPGATGVMETSDMAGEMPTPGHSQEVQTPAPITPDMPSDRGSMEEVKKRISEIIAQLPEISRIKDQVEIEVTDEGLRIELLDRETFHFFDVGSANVKAETKNLLTLIAQELGKLPNRVIIEGHTDSRPYGSQTYTNWELSADRANAARRLLEASGLRANQVLAVRGCADQQLRRPQDPLDPQNRRVSIIVNFQEKPSLPPAGTHSEVQESLKKVKEKTQNLQPPGPGLPAAPGLRPSPPPPAKGSPGAALPPPASEDRVREEVKRLFAPTGPQKQVGAAPAPRERLGW
jgi:chemotaxis protein MotB